MKWQEITLRDLARGVRGVSYKPSQLNEEVGDGNFFLLRANNIQDSKLILEDILIVDGECVSEKQELRKGDIVVCMSNGSKQLVGKNAVFNLSSGKFCVGAF